MNNTLHYLKLLLTHAALKSTNTTMKCLLIVLGGAAFVTEKPFYQQLILEGRPQQPAQSRIKRQQKMRQRFYELERQGFVEKQKKGNRFWYVLTTKGELRLLREAIKYAPPCKKDEQIFISYDIPEDFKSIRELFRRFLAENGFRSFHKSILTCHKDVETYLLKFITVHKLKPWVKIIRGNAK